MKQASLNLPLTEFEEITAKYFAGEKKPSDSQIALAVNKCNQWNKERVKKGLKPW
jgi:hypothetical protein